MQLSCVRRTCHAALVLETPLTRRLLAAALLSDFKKGKITRASIPP
jgi:hypothetical protein